MERFDRIIVSLLLASLMLPNTSSAQVRPPSSTQPGQVQQRLQIEQPLPNVGNEPLITLPEEGHKKALKGGITFRLKGVEFENLTAFTKDQLRPDYEKFIGKEVTLGTLNEIASKITAEYRNAGYILSRAVVPPQRLENGIAKIRIIEGYVNQVIIDSPHKDAPVLKKYADKIRNAKPLDAKTLERYLLLMEDLPGVTARAVIRPAANAPGASDVVVTLEEKRIDGSVTADNRGTRFMGPLQFGLTANANNLFGNFDRTQFHGVMTGEENELRYGQVSHDEELDGEGTKLTVAAGYTRTHPAYTLAAADLQGYDKLFSAEVSHPFIRSRQTNLYGNVEFDLHDSEVDTVGTELYNDKLRVFRAGGAFDFVDGLAAINKVTGTLSQGLNWDANSSDTNSRAQGRPDFFKGNFQASRMQPIYGPFDIYVASSGQWSSDDLLIAEQFGLGGADFNSAYDPSELTGDSGLDARVELRYNRGEDFGVIENSQFYTFYDIGKVWTRDVFPGQDDAESLADVGLGVRFNATKPLSGGVEFAAPLTKTVAADGQDGYRPRVFFSLAYRY